MHSAILKAFEDTETLKTCSQWVDDIMRAITSAQKKKLGDYSRKKQQHTGWWKYLFWKIRPENLKFSSKTLVLATAWGSKRSMQEINSRWIPSSLQFQHYRLYFISRSSLKSVLKNCFVVSVKNGVFRGGYFWLLGRQKELLIFMELFVEDW